MIKLKLDGIFSMSDSEHVSLANLQAESVKIPEFLNKFYEKNQGFHDLPKSKANLLAVKHLSAKLKPRFESGELKDIVVLGIGGSALGINCIRDALKGVMWNLKNTNRCIVLDNLDLIEEAEPLLNLQKSLFIVISKSGQTPETLAQFYYFKDKVPKENFVFISDPSKGALREISQSEGIDILDIAENIGGRFSVLSPVGLLPADLLGIDIDEMLDGALEMAKAFQSSVWEQNLPFQYASIQALLDWHYGIHMTVMMPYSSNLYTLADWYRQLLAESIGKDGKGLTPINALGATDQHSQMQLYNEGPNDKLISFIELEQKQSPKIPQVEHASLEYLSNVNFHTLMNLEKQASEKALTEYGKAHVSIIIEKLDSYTLGQLFMFFEASVAFLGEYYEVNAFDQPGVELGKQLTKSMLIDYKNNHA